MDNERLMIPGPIQLAPEVLAEMSKPITPHYGAEWTAFYKETAGLLKQIFRTEGDVFLMPGSGSAGLDAAIGSSLGQSSKMLVLSNGFFGERLREIARRYKQNTIVVDLPASEPISPEILCHALDADPEITLVGVVHSESSSGLLNPIRELGDICHKRNVLFLVDAISSLGGIELQMDAWHIDLCVSASQKCLEGPPGLGVVALSTRAWDRIKDYDTPGWYLNLHVWKEFADKWGDWHPYPATMAVPALRGLRCGMERVLAEGLAERIARHLQSASRLRQGLEQLGFLPVFPEAIASPTVVSAYGRSDLDADDVAERLRAEHAIRIGGGMGTYAGKAFRIGNMGPQAMPDQIEPLLDAMTVLGSNREAMSA